MTSYDSDISRGPHRLTVKRWHDQFNCHECKLEGSTRTVFIDLFVDGKMPDSIGPDDLVGETVEVAYSHGFIWLASEPRIVTDEPPECPSSPTSRHQVDTSMESGPNNCFYCERAMS